MVLSTNKRRLARPQSGPKSIILKGLKSNLKSMPILIRHIATIVALSLAGLALSGRGTINEKLRPA